MATVSDDGTPTQPRGRAGRVGRGDGTPVRATRGATLAFRCRAGITTCADAPREADVLVEYCAGFMSGRGSGSVAVRMIRTGAPSKHPTVFLEADCVHVTPQEQLRRTNCLVAQFAKLDGGKGERTKSISLALRGWGKGGEAALDRLWSVLHDAAARRSGPPADNAAQDGITADIRPLRPAVATARRARAPRPGGRR
jgi:hypothetical protein